MGKKFSITKTIDLNKLSNEIGEYVMRTGETKLHIFMHIDTMQAISDAVDFTKPPIRTIRISNCQDTVGYWEGNEVFIDNDLEFGEVEIKPSKCKHEWHMVGSIAGTKARYRVFVCSKCGEQYTERQVFNKENGTYNIFILDYEA